MIAAYYYDGRSSKRQNAALSLSHDQLIVAGDWGRRQARLNEVKISEPMGSAPRTLRFNDGAFCEIADTAGFASLLAAAGHKETLSVRMHQRWGMVLGALGTVIAVVVAAYLWLLPAAADYLAPRLPETLVAQLSDAALASLDEHMLEPSALPPQREVAISRRMAAFATQNKLPAYKLHFRATPKGMPPNAFALPDGDIVIFDSLLNELSDDEAIAVFAHELGHVAHHHGLRMLIQGTSWSRLSLRSTSATSPVWSRHFQPRPCRPTTRRASNPKPTAMPQRHSSAAAALPRATGQRTREAGSRGTEAGQAKSRCGHCAKGRKLVRAPSLQPSLDCPSQRRDQGHGRLTKPPCRHNLVPAPL